MSDRHLYFKININLMTIILKRTFRITDNKIVNCKLSTNFIGISSKIAFFSQVVHRWELSTWKCWARFVQTWLQELSTEVEVYENQTQIFSQWYQVRNISFGIQLSIYLLCSVGLTISANIPMSISYPEHIIIKIMA